MALTKDDLASLADLIDARIAASAKAPRAKQAAKAPKDTRTLAQRRAESAGGSCEEHGKRFATPNGFAFHMANTAHSAPEA